MHNWGTGNAEVDRLTLEKEELKNKIRELTLQIQGLESSKRLLLQKLRFQEGLLCSSQEMKIFSELESFEQEAIRKIFQIEGNGQNERHQVEAILRELSCRSRQEKRRVSEPLVHLLKSDFDRREWGVRCLKCGAVATIRWLKQKKCFEGGVVTCSHTVDGKTTAHGGNTQLPEYELVKRQDLRKSY